MILPKEVMELLGKKVSYCRAKPQETGETELFRGEGMVTGIIIGTTRRPQILVQDRSENADKAWTLDLVCINPTDDDANAYFEHHKKVKSLVEEHNRDQKKREDAKIKEVDELNYSFFGKPLDV